MPADSRPLNPSAIGLAAGDCTGLCRCVAPRPSIAIGPAPRIGRQGRDAARRRGDDHPRRSALRAWWILVGEDAKMLDARVRAKPEAAYDWAEFGGIVQDAAAKTTPRP